MLRDCCGGFGCFVQDTAQVTRGGGEPCGNLRKYFVEMDHTVGSRLV